MKRFVTFAALLVLAACGGSEPARTAQAASAPAAPQTAAVQNALAAWDSNTPKSLDELAAPVRIVNLWATWCKPCRKEMPEMSEWYRSQPEGSVDMVGIALDSTDNIGSFLKQTPVSYPIWRYTGNSSRPFMKAFGNDVGVLPFTLVEAPKCGYRQTITGEVNAASLTAALKAARAQCG
ncbi:TlpA disulfide reductase family protein [Neisseria animalis]|uniref:TlpA family protein disulfide reductase n=1 Tax=Neisseria animalis TaxID=492 RepID=A0A5P3MQU7_NEIAN|nr:TlpA disulfide reductase family protein [Neisseria animalis]QEY23954.1 TlpA family protein disulfide reductase [Neisseria animalis]ROW31648.1 TlpA family protein disulfide reductase [Neisseria animalis]VEE05946.1 thioredoxin [Neisseria animalis]